MNAMARPFASDRAVVDASAFVAAATGIIILAIVGGYELWCTNAGVGRRFQEEPAVQACCGPAISRTKHSPKRVRPENGALKAVRTGMGI
jgi:hypothetical protein